jgi:hypothetical protein
MRRLWQSFLFLLGYSANSSRRRCDFAADAGGG